MITENITVYAQWEEIIIEPVEYTVTYNANGGVSGIATYEKVEENKNPIMRDVEPSRIGYDFIEWSTIAEGNGLAFTTLSMITENITVYAQWEEIITEPVEYTVTYSANGRISGNTTSESVEENGYPILGNVEPFRERFKFLGWNTKVDGSGNEFNTSSIIESNIIVFAQWEEIPPVEFIVTYNANGGISGNVTSEIVEEKNNPTLSDVRPSMVGYNFIGWNSETDGSGVEFTISSIVESDIIVYAQWSEILPIEYIVSYDANGGYPGITTSEVVEENQTANLTGVEPLRAGYIFIGWNTSLNGTGREFNSSTMITEDIIIYAQWAEISTNLNNRISKVYVVYPNPASFILNSSFSGSYEILNITGNVVKKGEINNSIYIESLPQGTYVIKINSGNKVFINSFVEQ